MAFSLSIITTSKLLLHKGLCRLTAKSSQMTSATISFDIASRVPPASPSTSAGEKRKRDEMEADDCTWTLEAAAAEGAIPWDGKDWTGLEPVRDPRHPGWRSYGIWCGVASRASMLSARDRAAERSNRGMGVAAPVPRNNLQSFARYALAVVEDRRPPQSPGVPQANITGPAVPAGLANSDTEVVDPVATVLANQQAVGPSTEGETEIEVAPPKKRTPLPNARPQSSMAAALPQRPGKRIVKAMARPSAPSPASTSEPLPDSREPGLPTPSITPPHIHAVIITTDPTWHSMPIPKPPAMPAPQLDKETREPKPLSDKTEAAHLKAGQIRGPGAERHSAGPCLACKNRKGDKAQRCVVNPKVKDGNICAPCAMKKEKCWYTLLAEAEVIDKTGQEAEAPCEECLREADRRREAGDDEYKSRCLVQEDGNGRITACSACMKLGKKESCTLNSKPKKPRNGKFRDLAK
ncbi:hypothetical protein V8F33_008983 [Rhypophila sp. PSN 637]